MTDKQRKISITLFILAIAFTIIGSTLAYWNWQSSVSDKTNVTFTVTSGFSCSGDGGGSITSQQKMLAPTSCTNENYAFQREVTTNVSKNRDGSVYMDLWLDVTTIGEGLSNSQNFRYALTEQPNDCEHNILSEGTFNGVEDGGKVNLLEGTEYASTGNNTYYLYVWLDAAEESSSTQNQPFNISLGGQCTDEKVLPKLINKIKNGAVIDNRRSAYVSNDSGIDFSTISSDINGRGAYIRSGTENDTYPIYYFRGAVINNNVLFADFCWKMVRTTSTGGIKLIYNGVPTGTNNDKCENTIGVETQLSTNSFFNGGNNRSLSDVGYMYGAQYRLSLDSGKGWYYAPDVTYNNGIYTLVHKNDYNVEIKNSINDTSLDYYHYTCGSSTETTCTSVKYVYYVSGQNVYYITLTDGKKVEDALSEMLTNSSNTINSTIKTAIDTWYESNMTSYTSKLEDTPYCNDRTIAELGGWNPNGGKTKGSLYFYSYQRLYSTHLPSLICNKNDAFTVNAGFGNGKLTYPVGLLTADEIMLAGVTENKDTIDLTNYLYNNKSWWLSSPGMYVVGNSATGIYFYYNGFLSHMNVAAGSGGIRPAVSLKSDTRVVSGSGTSDTPYVVE